ncbi:MULTISPECIES: undecaprenyl-phosphate glucose phosphotransferase [Dickeya]|uniref:Undecaprenyl-phosphate glucose phosphotransferase n=2 Tax=Dickeya fangzhongdai TaxID=1778540 RepID=A0A2K8QJT1_9GAMM|nr:MULTISPECIES: undecaprenyl-phosphate glucose phosphotransferase [Dickeya]AIR68702.1 UDP-glucose lipid carrier transferase [Dickeya fangzhongdai]ATZ93777.1 undecaprenyl-phosphate glucose phosphotransferase [Dickeya fangzhongdai]AYH47417.1 undecaprenyl-phosphate glucose phosphotransferase [Dickeya fangzhongdai]KHN62636.1 UDP-glucose lipid carrier transferase [Dickeya fangzhongdai]MBO8135740.1 undecaprenyl-phosphate glucose phosphotransferase [Dickeya fangzhongdai]
MVRKKESVIYAIPSLVSVLQRFSDMTVIFISVLLACLVTKKEISTASYLIALISFSVFQLLAGFTNFYRSWRGVGIYTEIRTLIINWGVSVTFGAGILSLVPNQYIGYHFHAVWFLFTVAGFVISRTLIRVVVQYLRKMGYNKVNVAFIGAQPSGPYLAESIKQAPWMGLNIIGYFSENSQFQYSYERNGVRCLGNVEELIRLARKGDLDKIYVSFSLQEAELINHLMSELTDTTCTVMLVPDILAFNVLQSRSDIINGIPVVSLYDSPMSGVNRLLKRLEDIVAASIITVLISPLLLGIALLVKLTSKGPVIFRQRRYGMDGKAIEVWKFRSMTVMENGDTVIQASKGDKRVTPVGAFLRRTSLDELPQFINVIRGEMSIVGPRPHAVAHNEQYRKLIKGYMLRHKMKPGITGWAQINGWRGETDTLEKMEKRVECDLFYIENWSVWLDIKIIFLTIFKGFVSKSAY